MTAVVISEKFLFRIRNQISFLNNIITSIKSQENYLEFAKKGLNARV